jgi:site-specific DNA recombinase
VTKARRLQARTPGVVAPAATDADQLDEQAKRAVLYLRVSTPSQVKTDYNPEGISLPAQRDACEGKRISLGAETVREFVEPGRTATDIEHRPVFREMMAWVKAQKNIDYIIVYQFNRIFRNSIDAHVTKKELNKHGIRLVSASLDLGEGPESAMVESIMHAVDEYRSRADGADIAYKMGAKARNGGTLGRAPIGYLNARDLSEGRNIGIVTHDPERSPHIKAAFELYASGDYTIESLAEELSRRGLRTKPGRYSSRPVSTSKLDELLRDPYYIGYITYQGDLIQGRHERLISDDLFDRVQKVMGDRSGSGVRQWRHHHYLKGSLWCSQCHDEGVESRMIMQRTIARGGEYVYFFCKRKQKHLCDSRFVQTDAVEYAVLEFYGTIGFPSSLATPFRKLLHETLEDEEQATKLLHQQLTSQLLRLNGQEENLVDLAADGGLASAKIKQRLNDIQRQRNQIDRQLNDTDEHLAIGAAVIENALVLLDDPQTFYQRMAPEQRRLLNQAIFEKLYVYEDRITGATFKAPFNELLEARDAVVSMNRHEKGSPAKAEDPSEVLTGPLATVFFGGVSTKRVMVEVKGFEPSASTLRMYGSQWFDQVSSDDFPGNGVSIPSGSLTIPPLPSR